MDRTAAPSPAAPRLDATEGTVEGTRLTARAIAAWPRARAIPLVLPARFPRRDYDAIVIAELLYYLSPIAMRHVARGVAAALRPGGRLVLAHHRIDYYDFAQHAADIQELPADDRHDLAGRDHAPPGAAGMSSSRGGRRGARTGLSSRHR
jgi:SAM-dependent methyltransferase